MSSSTLVVVSRIGRIAVGVLAAALLLLTPAASLAAPPVSSVSDEVMCQCGCNSVLSQCPHQECGWGVPAKQFIAEQLDKGKSPDELIQYYVTQYGEEILAAPTKSGFNLAAWVTPFVVLIVGAVAVYYLAGTWSRGRRGSGGSAASAPIGSPSDAPEELTQRLDDELKEFD